LIPRSLCSWAMTRETIELKVSFRPKGEILSSGARNLFHW
jgi:hypothetical protein